MSAEYFIRPIKERDIPQILSLWNEVFKGAFMNSSLSEEGFRSKTFETREFVPEASFVAGDKVKIVGVITSACLRRYESDGFWYLGTPGIISSILVQPSCRRQGIGKALLEAAEAEHQSCGRVKMFAAGLEGAHAYFFPGVDSRWEGAIEFFKACGYKDVRHTCHIRRALSDYVLSEEHKSRQEELKKKGFTYSITTAEDEAGFEEYLHRLGYDGPERRLQRWRRDPGCMIAVKDKGHIVGKVDGLRVSEDGSAGFSLIDLLPEYRRRGLGTILLALALEWFKTHGGKTITLWTYPAAADRFYSKLGFKTIVTWLQFYKPLTYDHTSPQWIERWGH